MIYGFVWLFRVSNCLAEAVNAVRKYTESRNVTFISYNIDLLVCTCKSILFVIIVLAKIYIYSARIVNDICHEKCSISDMLFLAFIFLHPKQF